MMAAKTLPSLNALPLAVNAPSYAPQDYVQSDANREALAWITTDSPWPGGVMLLTGEQASGKTHLAHIWAGRSRALWLQPDETPSAQAPALVLDGCDEQPSPPQQEALLHLYNRAREQRQPLLLTCRRPFWHEEGCLPDLSSRLSAALHVPLEQPDDALLPVLLHKHAADRQLLLPPETADYLLKRLPRSWQDIAWLVARLDTASLAAGRKITLALARQTMESTRP